MKFFLIVFLGTNLCILACKPKNQKTKTTTNNSQVILGEAELAFSEGNFDDSIRLLNALSESNSDYEKVSFLHGLALDQSGKLPESHKVGKTMIEQQLFYGYLLTANYYLKTNQPTLFQGTFESFFKRISPDDPRMGNMIKLFRNHGKVDLCYTWAKERISKKSEDQKPTTAHDYLLAMSCFTYADRCPEDALVDLKSVEKFASDAKTPKSIEILIDYFAAQCHLFRGKKSDSLNRLAQLEKSFENYSSSNQTIPNTEILDNISLLHSDFYWEAPKKNDLLASLALRIGLLFLEHENRQKAEAYFQLAQKTIAIDGLATTNSFVQLAMAISRLDSSENIPEAAKTLALKAKESSIRIIPKPNSEKNVFLKSNGWSKSQVLKANQLL